MISTEELGLDPNSMEYLCRFLIELLLDMKLIILMIKTYTKLLMKKLSIII